MKNLKSWFEPLFYPRQVAIVGASAMPGKWGFGILHNLIAGGFQGKIYPVNSKGGTIQGLPVVQDVVDLPEAPDLAMVVVPPPGVAPALRALLKKGVRSVVIITGGFKETGEQGKNMEREIAAIAASAGIPVIGPNCQGIMSTHAGLHAQILFLQPRPGPISIVSQSGNVGGSIMHYGNVNNIGFNKFISSGNEAVIKIHHVLDYLAEDDTTRAVLIYVEGVEDGRAFFDSCRRLSLKKPVVAIKGGLSEAGSRACASHTGHLAGSAEIFRASCKQTGVILVDDLDLIFAAGASLIAHPLPRGRRVGFVTMGGGWGVLGADACARAGLTLPRLTDQTIASLDNILADRWSRGNPVDLAATPDQAAMRKALAEVAACESVDCVIQTNLGFGGAARKALSRGRNEPAGKLTQVVKFPEAVVDHLARMDMGLAEEALAISEKHQKPVISCTDVIIGDSVSGNPTLEFIAQKGIIVFPTPAKAARIMGLMADYADWLRENKA